MRSHRRTGWGRFGWLVAGTLAVAVVGAVSPAVLALDRAEASAPLRVHAAAAGKYIGSFVEPGRFASEPAYRAIVAQELSSITTGDALVWEQVQPSQGNFQFGLADLLVASAGQEGQLVRGRTLVWHEQNPAWLENLSGTALQVALANHIGTVMGRYQGQVAHWDVVSEPLAEDGSLRDSIWLQQLGPGYVAEAFQLARQADPAAKLYLNESNVEGIDFKSTALFNLVQQLLAAGVPIDGVGLQGRMSLGQVPSTLQQNIARFANLGLEVAITELQITLPAPPTQQALHQLAKDYTTVVNACVAASGCPGLTVSSVDDLWDGSFQPTPAYHAIHNALAAVGPPPDCTAAYQVVGSWKGGFQGEVRVTAGGSEIPGWRVTWVYTAGQAITSHWGAIITTNGPEVSADNAPWNGNLGPGGSTTFGFIGTHTGSNPVPAVACVVP